MRARAPRPDGRSWQGALGVVACAAALAGGCLEGSAPRSGQTSWAGEWAWDRGGCRQLLTLDGEGGFGFGVKVVLTEGMAREWLRGTLALEDQGEGVPRARFVPEPAVTAASLPYCAQWQRRSEAALPLGAASSALGVDVRTLAYREEISNGLGRVLIGTAGNRTDRLALYLKDGLLSAARLDTDPATALPYYFALPGDASRDPVLPVPAGTAIVNLPESFYQESFTVSGAGPLRQIILNLTQAAEVTFLVQSPNASNPRCVFVAYKNLNYTEAATPAPLDQTKAEQKLSLNPFDRSAPLVSFDVAAPGGTSTAYLLPLAIEGLAAGSCTVTVRGRSKAAAAVEANAVNPAIAPLFRVALTGSDPFLLGEAVGHGEAPRRLRWNPGVVARGVRGLPRQVVAVPPLAPDANGERPAFDVLGLLDSDPQPFTLSAGSAKGEPYLNLFGADGRGMGPFVPLESEPDRIAVEIPAVLSMTFLAAGASHTYRFTVSTAGRIALWSDGGLDTYATLNDTQGRLRVGDGDGAPDGRGFRIVRTLPPASYDLRVTSPAGPGAATLGIAAAGPSPVADEELEACLIASGLTRKSPGFLTELYCLGQGVTSLQGLAAAGNFRLLELAENRIADLTPLAPLSSLHVVSLAGNLVRRVDALANLPLLRTLGLAQNPLDPDALGALVPLADSLRVLDLTGVSSVSEAAVTALKGNMPNTIIVTPQGTVLP